MAYMKDSAGRRLDTFEVADAADVLDEDKLHAGALLARLQELSFAPAPAANIATVTSGTAYTITTSYSTSMVGSGPVTEVGTRGTYNDTFQRFTVSGTGAIPGLDFYLSGDTFELGFASQNGVTVVPVWVFVDGQPMTAAPVDFTVTAASLFCIKYVFPSAARRRIEVFSYNLNSWYPIRSTYTNLISPSPRRPVIAWVGDSYYSGSAASTVFQSTPFVASRMLGVECGNASFGGTGYVSVGSFNTFGSSIRQALVEDFNPDIIVVQGSVNDNGLSGIQAAATATFAAYAVAAPRAPIVVFGPQPTNATTTVGASEQANIAAVKAAALAAPNVIGFHDMVGTADGMPPTWASTGQTYNLGDRTVYNGAVYQWSSPVAGNINSPGTSSKWELVSYALTGTGRIGATAGNGTRDTYLYSDNVHPMPDANIAFGLRQVEAVRADLATAAGI